MYIADMHCDTIMMLWLARRHGMKIGLKDTTVNTTGEVLETMAGGLAMGPVGGEEGLRIDLRKLQAGGSLVQSFAMFIDLHMEDGTDPWTQFTEMARIYHEEIAANAEMIREARTYGEIMENKESGLISAVMTVEEGGVLEGDLARLDTLYEEGVRMMTLTWNYENELGCPNKVPGGIETDYRKYFRFVPKTDNGLKPFGFEAVERMGQLGIIVDVSHLSDAGFYDVAKTVKGPFAASHSNARSLCGCNRNMTDDMIRTVGEHGGVIGLNLCPDFLMEAESEEACQSTIEGMAKHARHMMNVGGREVVGIGTDYDGIGRNDLAIHDFSHMQELADGLAAQGFTTGEIEGICYENVLRVYREVL